MKRVSLMLAVGAMACGNVAIDCAPTAGPQDLAQRRSPYDSVTLALGETEARVCYSRPYANGRVIYGGLVPYDTLWRTGANEPTILHTPAAVSVGGIDLEPGHYSIYTVPRAGDWDLVINASTGQWGRADPDNYTDNVRAQEVGRAPISTTPIDTVEQFTISAAPATNGVDLHVDWETTRAVIPVRLRDAGYE